MVNFDDLECDLEILRDVVFRMEHEMKMLGDELSRVKQQLNEATRAMKQAKLESAPLILLQGTRDRSRR